LGHMASVGQFMELGQAHAQQKEQIRWSRRSYLLDIQALRLDLLCHAKDEIRAHYHLYVDRLETFLLVNALFMTFGLASLQFTTPFFPKTPDCEGDWTTGDCIEAHHPWLVTVWAWLVAATLVFPFWSILMLIRSKLKLHGWLDRSFASLNQERRLTIEASNQTDSGMAINEEQAHREVEQVVSRLGRFIVVYQDQFANIWNIECGGLVRTATALLWMTTSMAVLLVSLMFWMFLINQGWKFAPTHFVVVNLIGFVVPCIFGVWAYFHQEDKAPWNPEEHMSNRSFVDSLREPAQLPAQEHPTSFLSQSSRGVTGHLG